jgi:hypothetical protein
MATPIAAVFPSVKACWAAAMSCVASAPGSVAATYSAPS